MADEQSQQAPDAAESPLGGLGAMRLIMSGQQLPGAAQIDQMASQPVMDPSTKWLRYAAASLAPTRGGGFGESFSNSLGAYADATDKEAELKAKYLPIVAQALLQRQNTALTMQQNQQKLIGEWDDSLKGGLTGLMSNGNQVNPQSVVQMAVSTARQKGIPPVYLQQWLQSLPSDAEGLKSYALQSSVAGMGKDARLGAVTAKPEVTDTGARFLTRNTNPNAPGGVGPMSTAPMAKTLTPAEGLPKVVDTPQGQVAYNPVNPALTGRVGTPGANVAPIAGAAPNTPSVDTTQNPAAMASDKKYAEDFAGYRSGLDDKASSLADLNNRIGQMRQYASATRTGATADFRAKAGAFAKDMALNLGVPPNQADAIGNGLAGGDLGAAQAFQKLSVQGAMEALKSAVQNSSGSSAGRITQAEFAIFVKNNPSLEMDPKAMEKIHNFVADQYRKTLSEQDFVTQAQANGVPINSIRNSWAQAQGVGPNPPVRSAGTAKGSNSPKSTEQLSVDNSGRKIKLVNGMWEYE